MVVEHQTLKRIHRPLFIHRENYNPKLFKGHSRARETEVARNRTQFGLWVSYRLCHVAHSVFVSLFKLSSQIQKFSFQVRHSFTRDADPFARVPSGHLGGRLLLPSYCLAGMESCVLSHQSRKSTMVATHIFVFVCLTCILFLPVKPFCL